MKRGNKHIHDHGNKLEAQSQASGKSSSVRPVLSLTKREGIRAHSLLRATKQHRPRASKAKLCAIYAASMYQQASQARVRRQILQLPLLACGSISVWPCVEMRQAPSVIHVYLQVLHVHNSPT
jgi:hypothetical protein